MAMSKKILEQEPSQIEMLLPFHAAGTLNARELGRVDEALARDPALAKQYAAIREEYAETIHLNESLGAPSARAMQRLFAAIDAEPARERSHRSTCPHGLPVFRKPVASNPGLVGQPGRHCAFVAGGRDRRGACRQPGLNLPDGPAKRERAENPRCRSGRAIARFGSLQAGCKGRGDHVSAGQLSRLNCRYKGWLVPASIWPQRDNKGWRWSSDGETAKREDNQPRAPGILEPCGGVPFSSSLRLFRG